MTTDVDAGHFKLMSSSGMNDGAAAESSETEYQRQVSEVLGAHPNAKILSFKDKAPVAEEGLYANLTVIG